MELSIPLWFEVGSLIVLSLVLILDLLRVMWKPHVPSTKESALWVSFYVTLALVFAGAMFVFSGEKYGSEFLAGWVTEYSLSVEITGFRRVGPNAASRLSPRSGGFALNRV